MIPVAEDYSLVLSAGRTGTVFLTDALTRACDTVFAEHEPSPSRWEHVLGNMRHQFRSDGRRLQQRVAAVRRKKLASLPAGARYVELNPLLCPLVDLLPGVFERLRVVHVVREPGSWTRSMVKFKASVRWRSVIDRIPFALPYPRPKPAGWRSLSHCERTLWRWRFCNEQILSIQEQCASFELVRYEDLFSADPDLREPALRRFLTGLQIDPPDNPDWFPLEDRKNAAPQQPKTIDIPAESVRSICGELGTRLGYELPDAKPLHAIG